MKPSKRFILEGFKSTGVFERTLRSRWRSNRLLILAYHGLSLDDEHHWKPSFSMPPETFEKRLRMIKEGGYSVLPLGEAVDRLYAGTLPKRSVAITFDDGMHNFSKLALPLLKQYGFPATMYLTTYYCVNDLPVFTLLTSYLLWKNRKPEVRAFPEGGLKQSFDLSTTAGRLHAAKRVHEFSDGKRFSGRERHHLAQKLARHLGVDFDDIVARRICHLMTPAEVQAVASEGIDFELHTHRHRAPHDQSLFNQEIDDNRAALQQLLKRDGSHFCYPSGAYDKKFLPWLSNRHIATATTCELGLASSRSHRLLLPRFLDGANVSTLEFESWLTGVGAFLPKNPFSRV